MTFLAKSKGLQDYPYEALVEGCPSEVLKSVESLKSMGTVSTVFEISFKTINELEIFTRILNREEDEERVANELKVTYFHNVRGKIKKSEMVKNEEFSSMKKVRFNSSYHVTLFLKYYQDRIKQIENEYRYTITSGREAYLYVYLNNDENISSMFINEIRDMKKRLNFLEIKDEEICERFTYSEKLGEQLKKLGLFHEIWYRGRQSTIIFYSEKQSLRTMKNLINNVSRFHITIFKMTDQRFPFLVNYFLFVLLKKTFWPQIRKLSSVEMNQIEFNENKVGVVVHDMHEVYTPQIKSEILERMKNFVLISYRATFARGYFNWLKKNFFFDESLNFSYSKKTVCICVNLEKLKSHHDLIRVFSAIGESINYKSQITFNWFHLQDESLVEYRRELGGRVIEVLSSSAFYVENFEKLEVNKDLKCVVRLKNANADVRMMSESVGRMMANVVAVWNVNAREVRNNNRDHEVKGRQIKQGEEQVDGDVNGMQQNINQNHEDIEEEEDQSDSQESQYEDCDDADIESPSNGTQQQAQQQQSPIPPRRGFLDENNFTETLFNSIKESETKYFNPQNTSQQDWKVAKSWRKAEEELLTEIKLYTKIKKLQINCQLKEKLEANLQKIRESEGPVFLEFRSLDSYSPNMFESPFYKTSQEKKVRKFDDFKAGQKFVVCCELEQDGPVVSYPLCSFEVMKRF